MSEIVLATGNRGKLREMQALFTGLPVTLRAQTEFNIESADETGVTFVENALIKARHAAELCQRPAIADDSGLSVDCLGGQPGVWSARYAGADGDDAANNAKLLNELAQHDHPRHHARFVCVMVFVSSPDDPLPVIAEGQWHGEIIAQPRGGNGFGYDPLFYVPEFDCTSAELPPEQKNAVSHRGLAAALLRNALVERLQPNTTRA